MTDLALKDVPEAKDTETALIAKEVDIEGGRVGPESKSKAEDEKGKANEMNIDYPNLYQAVSSADLLYIMPKRVGHASLGNLGVLHQKANGSTIAFTHCEQENEIT